MSLAQARQKPIETPSEARMACRWCGTSTKVETLNALGARCARCYDLYVVQPIKTPEFMGDRRVGIRTWAEALKKREESGERIGSCLKAMWRSALRVE